MAGKYNRDYEGKTLEELMALKKEQERRMTSAKETWATTNLAGEITMAALGLVFLPLLPISIPLLIIGIRGIVVKSKTRLSANREIWNAQEKIADIEFMMDRDHKVVSEQ